MDRRGFLISGGAAAVASGATPHTPPARIATSAEAAGRAGGEASGARVLTLAAAPGYDLAGFGADRLAQHIGLATVGRVRVERIGASAAADLRLTDARWLATLHPAFAFFAGLPLGQGLASAELDGWLMLGGGQQLWDELARPFGWKPLVAGHTGEGVGLWSSVRLEAASDLVGLPVAATGLAARVLEIMGAEVIDVAPPDLGSALTSARVRAGEAAGPLPGSAFALEPLAPCCYRPGLYPHGAVTVLLVASRLWEGLDAADQAIFEAGAAAEYRLALAEANMAAAIATYKRGAAKWPVRTSLPPSLANTLAEVATAVVEEVAGFDAASRRIAASYRAYRAFNGVRLA
jgi:TRAP-type mannitol/chloroaromatic compound transport system substrate-binding protein